MDYLRTFYLQQSEFPLTFQQLFLIIRLELFTKIMVKIKLIVSYKVSKSKSKKKNNNNDIPGTF